MTLLIAVLLAAADAGAAAPAVPAENPLHAIQRLAKKLEPTIKTPWVKAWLATAQELPSITPRTYYCDKVKRRCLSEKDALALADAERAPFTKREVNDETYYARIADPLGYARAYELLAAAGFSPKGKKLIDFGYGSIGQLAMLARVGADASGIEVDPLLPMIYSDAEGKVRAKDGTVGSLRILHGFFAKDAELVREVGGGYDLFISKNTLKRGYVRPEVETPANQRIDVGTDEQFLGAVRDLLKPGGLFFIYNFSPAPAPKGKPYLPMADGRCPWSKEVLQKAGFEVLSYDVTEDDLGRAMAHVLEWDKDTDYPMDIDKELFTHYTLMKKVAPR